MRLLVVLLLTLAPAQGHAQFDPFAGGCPGGQCPLVAVPPAGTPSARQSPPANLVIDVRAIARIANRSGSATVYGSGTLVDVDDDGGLILTCAHLFREAPDRLSATFADGRSFEARLLKVDHAADLAALAIRPPGVEPIEIALESPQRGDDLVFCGYGGDGRLLCIRGQALGYVTTLGSAKSETLELTGAARFGDSGGPVLDCHHRLVAVLFGTNGRVVDGTCCGRIRRFLTGLSARFRARRHPSPPKEIADACPLPGPVDGSPQATQPAAPPADVRPAPPQPKTPPTNDLPTGDSIANQGPQPDRQPTETSPAPDPLGSAADSLENIARPWISARVAALLVSLGLPAGIAGVAAGAGVWLLMRRGRKRIEGQLNRLKARLGVGGSGAGSEDSAAEDPTIVERHHNRYVAYETTTLDKAWAAAHAQVGEKYPGAVPYLKIAESVKDQLLAGTIDPQLS